MKRALLGVGTSLILLCCGTAAWAQSPQVVSARAGAVNRVEGEVVYHCHDKESGIQTLETGVKLHDGDLVFTDEKSSAQWALNPDSHLTMSANSTVRVYKTDLDQMHFDLERGEVIVVIRSVENGVSLVIHAPPGLLAIHKSGRYRFRVAENGETEAAVVEGELRYKDSQGNPVSVKKGSRVNFYKVEKKIDHSRFHPSPYWQSRRAALNRKHIYSDALT
jgi:hypothetical protein